MTVRHRSGAYEVRFVGLGQIELPEGAVIVTDRTVGSLYAERFDRPILTVPAGESSKSIATWATLVSDLARQNRSRNTTLIALGGGVIGDLAGFVAAAYMRGIPLIQIPTTLLAQVDSSVGGKVGIDLPEGKNLVGAFYPPAMVYVCDEVLDTLPERDRRNGMAEVCKYGFILDRSLIDHLPELPRSALVRRCIDLKRQVVEADEFETTGERAKLNFGHTVGHAIEKVSGYGAILHGEAISIGMVAEAALGEAIGLSESGVRKVVEDCLASQGLPTTSVVLRNVDALIEAMVRDKKARNGGLAFALLTSIGACTLVHDVPERDVRSILAAL